MDGSRLVLGTDGGTSVVLRDARPGEDGWSYFVVELHAAGLDVSTGVEVHRMRPLTAFWNDMESNWKGWSGERKWESTEPGLAITALHDGRHIRTVWTVTGGESEWSASLELWVEPGEELVAATRDIQSLLGDA